MKNQTLFPSLSTSIKSNSDGYYGSYGGRFVPPVLESRLEQLTEAFHQYTSRDSFQKELDYYLTHYVGRPSPLYLAKNLSALCGSKLYLKREDLNHTGAHKINNAIGQALIARNMGVKELVAETGAGQHGVATATVAALMGMKCRIFMGSEDALRQEPNVARMKLLGAQVITTSAGTATLRDAVDAALDYYIEHPETYYLLGSQVGPHPYPTMVGYFQKVIGREARRQILETEGKLPDALFASVGGGSNAIGLFQAFLLDEAVAIFGAEGGGTGDGLGETAASLSLGKPMIFHGFRSYCLADEFGNAAPAWSVAAGLDYPSISPQHAALKDAGRVRYQPVYDHEAIAALKLLAVKEGIIAAVESAHAVALALDVMQGKGEIAIVNLSGRGDKDIARQTVSG